MRGACGLCGVRGSGRRASGASILGADTGDVARGAGVVMTDDAKRLLVGDERSDVAWDEPGECAASLEDDILARTPSREVTGGSDRVRVSPGARSAAGGAHIARRHKLTATGTKVRNSRVQHRTSESARGAPKRYARVRAIDRLPTLDRNTPREPFRTRGITPRGNVLVCYSKRNSQNAGWRRVPTRPVGPARSATL